MYIQRRTETFWNILTLPRQVCHLAVALTELRPLVVPRSHAQLESSGHPGLPVHLIMFYRNVVISPSIKTKLVAEESTLSSVDTSH